MSQIPENQDAQTALEQAHLRDTLALARSQYDALTAARKTHTETLRAAQEELLERGSMDMGGFSSAQGFTDLLEMSYEMTDLRDASAHWQASDQKILTLTRLLDSPYFARIDFTPDDGPARQIYIGRATLMDDATLAFYVYDWRTPIAGLFYQFGVGPAHYDAPGGRIAGRLTLKRQYEIRHGRLEYFFDADTQISDAFLRQILSRPVSTAMKGIVETIQRDQDRIIRDLSTPLLMVQGAAGSGKTSVALHRVAYLMYEGLKEGRLSPGEILIIAPNATFERYIAQVLPDLGESPVRTLLFEELLPTLLPDTALQPRSAWVESFLTQKSPHAQAGLETLYAFLGSNTMVQILDRFAAELQHRWLPFADITYDGHHIQSAGAMRQTILDPAKRAPLGIRLQMLETALWRQIHPLRPARLQALTQKAQADPLHYTEAAAYARMLSIEESGALLGVMRTFTQVDCAALYARLLHDEAAFLRLSEGLLAPEEAARIRALLAAHLPADAAAPLPYGHAVCVAYLRLVVYGHRQLTGTDLPLARIRQLAVDEVQDLDALHLTFLARLFPNARYTLLGDIHQALIGAPNPALYSAIREALAQPGGVLVTLDKSFRCTREIWDFSTQFLPAGAGGESFSRNGDPVLVHTAQTQAEMDAQILFRIQAAQQAGIGTIACICKTAAGAHALHARLSQHIPIKLIDNDQMALATGVSVLPLYMAKGLEFDAAFLADADAAHYATESDRGLLYIGCTRALHRLELFAAGALSPLITERSTRHAH